jgi:DNA-binding LacI/PurR family transcriptional regulator
MADAGLARHVDVVSADAYGIEGGAAAMAALMDRPTLPTAVVAEYDELAIGAVRTLRRASIPVPGRLSVVGVDDHEMASVVDLTTVSQPVQEQGSVAARLLLDILDDGATTASTEVVLPTRLVVRGSTGTPFTRPPA